MYHGMVQVGVFFAKECMSVNVIKKGHRILGITNK